MESLLVPSVLLLISLASACRAATTELEAVGTKQKAERSQDLHNQDLQAVENLELRNQIEQIAAAAKGHVGVAAVVLETGETVSLSPHDHFPMQSVFQTSDRNSGDEAS